MKDIEKQIVTECNLKIGKKSKKKKMKVPKNPFLNEAESDIGHVPFFQSFNTFKNS